MIEGILVLAYSLPIVVHLGTNIYKKSKAKKDAINNLESMGYDIDKHYINKIFDFLENKENLKDHKENLVSMKVFVVLPYINFIVLVCDILDSLGVKFFCWDEFSKMSEDKIKYLLEEDVISENKEKQLYLRDYNNALKELEKKYDEMTSVKKESIVVISEKDSTDELYEKLEILQEMILRRQTNNDEVITDINTLKYGNKEGKKNEEIKQ